MKHLLLAFLVVLVVVLAHEEEVTTVTCGSAFKLVHIPTNYHVTSSQVTWGSGSHLQAITACEADASNPNSLWQIGYAHGRPACAAGEAIKCGDLVSLRHVNTRKYLRSSTHRAPLSGRQEVSGDDGNFGPADTWILECVSDSNGAPLRRDAAFRLRHKQTGLNLFTRAQDRFTPQNCRGCPIVNHLEMSASGLDDRNARFRAGDGYFMPVDEERIVRDYTDFSAPVEGHEEKREKDEL